MELIAEVVFLGAQNDGHAASTVFTKAWEHAFHCARRGLVRDDTSMPLFIVADGFPLELFDSVQQCLDQPRRLHTFDAPSVTIVSDIPDNALASDLLKVLARSSDNCRYLEDIRQAMVFPPVSHASKPIGFRLVILWLSDHDLDLSPLATVWTGCERLAIKHEILAGYWDLLKLGDMHAQSTSDTESSPHSSLSDLHRTAGRGGRGGRGWYGPATSTPLSSEQVDVSTGSVTTTVPPGDWSSITRRVSFDPEAFITGIVNKKLEEVTHRLDRLTEGIDKADKDRALAEFDRQVSLYAIRVSVWFSCNSAMNKTRAEVEYLQRERESICDLRAHILQMPYADSQCLMDFP